MEAYCERLRTPQLTLGAHECQTRNFPKRPRPLRLSPLAASFHGVEPAYQAFPLRNPHR